MSERVRYGRIGKTRVPKNTLITIRKGDIVYFGIARCRSNVDHFTKESGLKLAKLRVEVSQQHPVADSTDGTTFKLHQSGVFGQVDVSEIKKLLIYFDNIDNFTNASIK